MLGVSAAALLWCALLKFAGEKNSVDHMGNDFAVLLQRESLCSNPGEAGTALSTILGSSCSTPRRNCRRRCRLRSMERLRFRLLSRFRSNVIGWL